MSNTPELILQLVETFDSNIDNFKKQNYNEAQVRQQFINPFFEALGWDMQNKAGIALAYSDVIHEDAIKVGGSTKAPDYCFRIGGTRKFFVEAKRPSIDIKSDISPAYQLRRYAWNAKLPLSILTDFEEFAVYDCRIRPNVNDKPSTARIFLCTYKEYADKWEQIAKIFSKEAVYKGLFDKYASEKTTKRGTTTVDKEFLAEIEEWRNELAKNIAIRNGKLSVYDLNFAVQKTIDRILFLRICEDRGIERSDQLLGLVNGTRIYPRLFELFEKADEKYNSGVFHFHKEKDRPESPDELSANLKVDDDVLKKIIKDLYYPCPYEFSIMPAEILGNVYEQFLGKVIRLTASHQAKVEEKPEVKKAGGVYYTPSYIVDYIVKNTVGKLCEGKTPKQIEKLKILDPACGSGSFLIGAYQYLLDFHRDYYAKDPSKHKKAIYQGKGKQWFLTIEEKKRILLNNIYGVDIDSQAVEVTKLSLLLKVLENETQESLRLFHERALPDLGSNIKCGNSLIGYDFYQNQQLSLFGEEEKYKINAFDWQAGFPEIFKLGGFDAVIGNPPYGADYTEFEKRHFQSQYVYKKGKPETYIFFLEKGVMLLKTDGLLGYITPNAWLTNYYGVQLRQYILDKTTVVNVVDLEKTKVFVAAVVDTVITILKKSLSTTKGVKAIISRGTKDRKIFEDFQVDQNLWRSDPEALINLQANPVELNIITKMEATNETLGDATVYSQGVIPYKTKKDGEENLYISQKRRNAEWLPLIERASQVRPYQIAKPEAFIHYGRWLWCAREERFFSQWKILFHRLRKKLPVQLVGTIDSSGVVNRHALSNLILKEGIPNEVLLAILGFFNARLTNWWFVKRYGLLMEVGGFKVAKIPLPKKWMASHNKMVSLVEQMLELNKKLAEIKNPDEKTRLQRQIDATDAQIDKLVYDLYGLTPEEIAIVESSAGG